VVTFQSFAPSLSDSTWCLCLDQLLMYGLVGSAVLR